MRIERHFTTAGVSPYELIPFATTKSEIRNPDGSVVFSLDNIEVPAAWSQVAADVLAQKYFRKAGVPARLKRVEEESVPSFLWRSVADETALGALPKAERYGSEISAKQVFDRLAGAWAYWGWKAGDFEGEDDARAYYDEMRFMLARQIAAPNSPQWFNTGLHWAYGVDGPSQGHYYVDFETGRARQVEVRLRASAAARLLHPVRRRRPRQRGRHHGPLGPRGAALQIRLRNGLELLGAARREREAFGRRALVRPHVLPQDRRPGGGRDQVRRHDPARGQDGRGRRRPPGHRILYRLEGEGGAEGRRARRGLEARPEAPQGDPQGLRELRRPGRRLLRHREEPRPKARGEARPPRRRAGRDHQAHDPARPAGRDHARLRHLRHRLGVGGLSHRLGPELQQFRPRDGRLPARRRDGRRVGSRSAPRRQAEAGARPEPLGEDRLRRLGLGRSGPPVSHHDQRLAHLPGIGADPRLESVLGIYVPRRHGVQSGVAEPPAVSQPRHESL